MEVKMVVAIILVLFLVLLLALDLFVYLRDKSLSDIRADVYQLFLQAENNPELAKKGRKKMEWVLKQARGLLPAWAQFFITDALLENVVQAWFDAVKDLLDDGKLNKSGHKRLEG